ncbi:polysaccharide pyruvyl transferase family protein [Lacunimicrobium album]
MLQRRDFLATTLATSLLAALHRTGLAQDTTKPLKILLRGSWQIVNIGDIAHTPGALAIIEKHLPQAEVILWSSADLTPEVSQLLTSRFPKLKVVKGSISEEGKVSTKDLQAALDWCDFLLHGSGASFVAYTDVARFDRFIQKPFGIYGITYSADDPKQIALLNKAKFAFFRDGISLQFAKDHGVSNPTMGFGPDGAFGTDLRNDAAAEAFLKQNNLTPGKFLCCIPRYRYTPYWLIKKGRPLDEAKNARNQEMREHDHAILREAIIAVAKNSDHKVLVCPEDMTQMQIGKEDIINKLPKDVLPRVVWRENYWLTDEALSTYTMSSGLFGLEMHSPIMCIGNGIPAIVGRFEEQTTKGFMWKDIGLADWLFDFDKPEETAKLNDTVLSLVNDPQTAKDRAEKARAFVEQRQKETILAINN